MKHLIVILIIALIITNINWIESHPVVISLILFLIGGYFTKGIVDYFKTPIGYMKPVFYITKNGFNIIAVHEYKKSNNASGYEHLGQNSRKDQWEKLISIKSSLFGMRQEIVPNDKNSILTIVIDIQGRHNNIDFNK